MKAGWHYKNLGDVCHVIGGGTPSKANSAYYTGDISWATVRDMHSDVISETECRITQEAVKHSATNIIPAGNVVIATRVGLGKVCTIAHDTAINQDLRGIIPISEKTLNVRFLFWWFKSISDVIVSEGTGATVQGVKIPFVKSLQIPLPPLPEQQRIVGILDEAFEGIATAKANAEKNLRNAREIFESHLQSVFNQRGAGWVERRLDELGTITSSKRIYKNEYVESGVPFYRTKEVKELANGKEISTELFITEARYEEIKAGFGVPKTGDILLTAIGTIGEIYVVASESCFYFKDGNVLWLKDFATVNPYFLKYVLVFFVEGLNKMAHGSAYSALPIQRLQAHSIFVPPQEEQIAIAAQLDALSAETQHLADIYEQKLAALEELKKSLLHKAFAGEL
jgi:type I restriction enzyme, S subunit